MKCRAPQAAERARAVIERQVNHLMRLVDDLLDVVPHRARQDGAAQAEPLELAEVVANAIEIAGPLLEQRAHTLKVDVPRRGLIVDADAARLAQVIANLLTNAAKYTPPGGRIDVAALDRRRRDRAQRARHGIGIRRPSAAEHLRSVRAGARRRSTARRAASASASRSCAPWSAPRRAVEARSDGRGPRQRVHRAPAARGARPGRAAGRSDSRTAGIGQRRRDARAGGRRQRGRRRDAVHDALRLQGYDVRVAHDGAEALQRGRGIPPRGGAARHRSAGHGRLRARAPPARHARRWPACA